MATSIDGLTIFIARKICSFAFGDYFIRADLDHENVKFRVLIKDQIEGERIPEEILTDFSSFWGKNWNIIMMTKEEAKMLERS